MTLFPLQGNIPLVVNVDSADVMATLLKLKAEVEGAKDSKVKLVFSGATEAHLLAEDIGNPSSDIVLSAG